MIAVVADVPLPRNPSARLHMFSCRWPSICITFLLSICVSTGLLLVCARPSFVAFLLAQSSVHMFIGIRVAVSEAHCELRSGVRAGENHVLAVTVGGKVLSWGTGQQGQLGRLPARRSGRGNTTAALLNPAPVVFVRKRQGTHTSRCVLCPLCLVHAWSCDSTFKSKMIMVYQNLAALSIIFVLCK